MVSHNVKLAGVGVLACAALVLGAWQARSYFTPRQVSDAGGRPPAFTGKNTQTTTDGTNRNTNWSEPVGTASREGAAMPAVAEPEVATQFVKVPSKPESVLLLKDAIPLVAKAVTANVDLGQATRAAQNALVAAAMDSLSKILGVDGMPADAMGERVEPPASNDQATAVATTTNAAPAGGPDRGAMFSGLTALLKDASIDASRAKVEFFPDGAVGLPKRTPGEPRRSGSEFQATMRFAGRMFSGEKRPTAEVRIPVKIKESPGPGDDLDIGVILERDESGEKWSAAGFNLHMKKPEIMKKMSGSMPAGGRRQAPQPAPGGAK